MKKLSQLLICLLLSVGAFSQPICLNPGNPHYFLYRGKPLVIISSSEHYGAVLNPAFDILLYLNTLQKDGMNYTRLFAGSYFEKEGSFGIEHNTLAPSPGEVLLPWKRSNIAGAVCGGNKFDLNNWDERYFIRLKSFVSEASKRGIIVEVTLFSSIYGYWDIQVWNPKNNINLEGSLQKEDVQILKNANVLDYQVKFVRRIVRELNAFDNVTYEIQNEPWCDHTLTLNTEPDPIDKLKGNDQPSKKKVEVADQLSLDWQKKIASVITDEEKNHKNKHIIAQNYCNHYWTVPEVEPYVSILNFHYAYPAAVDRNYKFNKVIAFDESGFAGSDDFTYRQQAWKFILSGGGLFNNLDYSFYAGRENGTGTNKAPGGGSPDLRRQLKVLSDFIRSFDILQMQPDHSMSSLYSGSGISVLSEPGKQYAIYFGKTSNGDLQIKLNEGSYHTEWINTLNGDVIKTERLNHAGGEITLTCPSHEEDIALKIIRQ